MEQRTNDYALLTGTTLVSPQTTYIIRRVLGYGGFGITYLADMKVGNILIPEAVCIKEFFPRSLCERDKQTHAISYSTPTKDQVERTRRDFIGEAHRLATLAGRSQGIVVVNEVFETNNTAYYVMEYLRGQTLADYVKTHGSLSWSATREIFQKLISAVAFLHRNHVTHLDIKPTNIMLVNTNQEWQPVLIDFGLSKHYNEDGSATSTINSQGFSDGYAPIEQYGGITHFSPHTDVYALAATIVYCLTGRRPAAATTDPEFEPILSELVPADDCAVLLKALSYRSKDRYKDADTLYIALYRDNDNTSGNNTQILTSPPTADDDESSATIVIPTIPDTNEQSSDSDTEPAISPILTNEYGDVDADEDDDEDDYEYDTDYDTGRFRTFLRLLGMVCLAIIACFFLIFILCSLSK